jgi:phosphatidylglycerophosphate synthase
VSRVSLEQVRATYKKRDAWWTVLLVDPLAGRLIWLAAGLRWLTPTRLTIAAFLLGLVAAAAFLAGTPGALVVGAILYYTSFVIDCMDGKIARLRGTGSIFGSWLDFLLDRVRVAVATLALFGGQYLLTENAVFLLAASGVIFLALFGYLNGAETDKAKQKMARLAGPASHSAGNGFVPVPAVVNRLRAALHHRRIRLNLVSGVEFEMALFVVAPLAAATFGPVAIWWVTGVAAALLVGFELALFARFWLTARAFDRAQAAPPAPAPARPEVGQRAPSPAA